MNNVKNVLGIFFLFSLFFATLTKAQTPFDEYAPGGRSKPMLTLPEAKFRVYNPDTMNDIRYVELDKESGILAYYDKQDSLLGSLTLAETEKKWLSTDPLAKKYPGKSPYIFCSDNPLNRIDADGRDDFTFHTLTYITSYKVAGEYKTQIHTVTSVDVVRNNNPNTYTAHNIVATEDLTNGTKSFSEGYTDVHKISGQYLSENWGEISKLYPPEMSRSGTPSSFGGLSQARASKEAYEISQKEDRNNIVALNLMLSAVPIGDFLEMAAAAKAGTTVLGKYPDYINLAEKLGANRFNVPTDIWNKMSATEQWGANQRFLDRAIFRGDKIILSNPVSDINKVSGAFRQELDYAIGKGYKLNSTGIQLIK